MPLYEFLSEIHDQSRLGGACWFEDMRIMVDGKELIATKLAQA